MEKVFYGNAILHKAKCPDCEQKSIVIKGRSNCCNTPITDNEVTEINRKSITHNSRFISQSLKFSILKAQKYKCFYCRLEFGTKVYKKAREIILRAVFDHIIPYFYDQNNKEGNIVASCQVCNHIKSALMFENVEDITDYVQEKWTEKGYSKRKPLRTLRKTI